jgi:hypothetical protein
MIELSRTINKSSSSGGLKKQILDPGDRFRIRSVTAVTYSMAGLGLFDQKIALAVTTPIVTAFKFCIGHRKNGLLSRKPTEVKFWCF